MSSAQPSLKFNAAARSFLDAFERRARERDLGGDRYHLARAACASRFASRMAV